MIKRIVLHLDIPHADVWGFPYMSGGWKCNICGKFDKDCTC